MNRIGKFVIGDNVYVWWPTTQMDKDPLSRIIVDIKSNTPETDLVLYGLDKKFNQLVTVEFFIPSLQTKSKMDIWVNKDTEEMSPGLIYWEEAMEIAAIKE